MLPKIALDCNKLLLIYNSCIRSILEYFPSLLVGINVKLSTDLESIQKRAYRIIFGVNYCIPNHEKLCSRRHKASVKLFTKALSSSHCLNCILPHRSIFSNRYILPHISTTRRLNTFPIKTATLLNLNM